MLLLAFIVALLVGTVVLAAVSDGPRYPLRPDERDLDMRRRWR
jgi:hypothetical protein